MDKTPEYLEREFIKGILVATANELVNKGIDSRYELKTKLAKIVTIVADAQKIPITRSWYNYGQYPFLYGLNIELDKLFFSIIMNIKESYKNLSNEANETFEKATLFFKKFDVTNNIIKKNLFIFLESYYNNRRFNDMEYIGLYRTFFHLNNFVNNNFYINLNKEIIPKKIDYTKYLVEEVDISEEDRTFDKYTSQVDKIRPIFNSFLFELEKPNYNFSDEIREKVYPIFNNFEKVCLKMDFISQSRNPTPIEIKSFDKLSRLNQWYWSLLASFISTQKNEGLRKEILIEYYNKLLRKNLSEEKIKREEVNQIIRNTKLELSREEFSKVKSKDRAMVDMIHNFTKSI